MATQDDIFILEKKLLEKQDKLDKEKEKLDEAVVDIKEKKKNISINYRLLLD